MSEKQVKRARRRARLQDFNPEPAVKLSFWRCLRLAWRILIGK